MASALGPRWPLRPALGGGGGRLLFVLLCASAGLPRSSQQVLRIGECRPRARRAPHRGTARSRRRGPGRRRGLLAPGLFPYLSPRVFCLCRRSGTRAPPAGRGARRSPRGAAAMGLGLRATPAGLPPARGFPRQGVFPRIGAQSASFVPLPGSAGLRGCCSPNFAPVRGDGMQGSWARASRRSGADPGVGPGPG